VPRARSAAAADGAVGAAAHAHALALVALHAPSVDPANGDARRLRRLLAHELAHVLAAERTGSVKRLGDGNRGMRLAEWVDEGFAVNLAAAVTAEPGIIDSARSRASGVPMSDDALAAAFRDLNAPERSSAFAIATARVWRALQAHGLAFVFEHLSDPERWTQR